MQSKILTGIRPEGLEDAPQLQLDIDRDKAQALGVTFDAINTAISTSLGSSYVNDFPNAGRLQRVVVQADAKDRMQPEDLLRLNALNTKGQPVPLSAFATTKWITGPMQTTRYNGYPAMSITGEPPSRAIRPATRCTRCRTWRPSCRPASPTSGPASRARRSCPARPCSC
jgi:multidrug efflux pump